MRLLIFSMLFVVVGFVGGAAADKIIDAESPSLLRSICGGAALAIVVVAIHYAWPS